MSETLSMYNACIPTLDRWLSNLDYVLKKGEANAKERDIDPSVFLNARLAPDMHPLKKQVQMVASLAKNCPHRIMGSDAPVYEETEETFEELYALIAKARKDVSGFKKIELDGREDREFNVEIGPMNLDFTGISYFSGFTLPNIMFHCTTTYNILRHNGVPIGKLDFLGGRL